MFVAFNRLCWFSFLIAMAMSLGCADFGSRKKAVAILRVNREGFTGNAADFLIFKETQAQVLQSRLVINAALKSNKLRQIAGLSADKVAHSIDVELGDETEIMVLSLRLGSWNANEGKAILDGVIEAYEYEVTNKQRMQGVAALTTTRKRYAELLDNIAEKSDAVAKLAATLGTQDDEAKESQTDLKLKDRKEELQSLQTDLEKVRKAMDQLELEIDVANRVTVLQDAVVQ